MTSSPPISFEHIPSHIPYGFVSSIIGSLVEVSGLSQTVSVGDRCQLQLRSQHKIDAEVVGFKGEQALVMPFSSLEGVGPGCKVLGGGEPFQIAPHHQWLGRVLNAESDPIDDLGPLCQGERKYRLKISPLISHQRRQVGERLDLGVRALNVFLTCCRGQRMGIFAGSGVGKSMLMGNLARFARADVIVIGLIGERGREVKDFIHKALGEEGLKRSVLVVSTSDEPALKRRQAAYLTITIAEYFRDQGLQVLCMMDSVTRFAMALREIGLAVGEPPASKGYTPSVFAELPQLLERAGPGIEHSSMGNITGLFTVLVEGDDHNEPIADAVRGILDGHIVLERGIAERGRFPAINILKSVSRTMPDCHQEEENLLISKARRLMSIYEDMAEMIRLGAYRAGTNSEVDEAIKYNPALENFLKQRFDEFASLESSFQQLYDVLHSGGGKIA